jgi:hypothetical protein
MGEGGGLVRNVARVRGAGKGGVTYVEIHV